ncbi:MAG: toprim domain-containing protein, partial [Nitrospirota bacterium]|nr:toprim domain-containing protein [Nitrospirota bacterium]
CCPQCSHTRKKSRARCLSVNTVEGVWCCHHCDWRGTLKAGKEAKSRPPKRTIKPHFERPAAVPPAVRDWFAKRRIPETVVARHNIALQSAYLPQIEEEAPCLVFPYFRDGQAVNLKFRSLEGKHFRQVKDAEKILYGLDDVAGETCVIVEGEIDKLSLEVAGITSAVSVPDGAPPAGSKSSDAKFEYLVNCTEQLSPLKKIIIAVDNDAPGKTLEEELARRLGPERCWRVTWPDGCKDANDVLLQHGVDELRYCITNAKPLPIDGVFTVADLAGDVMQLYLDGLPGGVSTGWPSVDAHYTVRPGEMTIVTGIPSHGKSQFLDALTVNLAREHEWAIGVCSPENLPVSRHVAKLIEQYSGFPFREGPSKRVPQGEVVTAINWLHEHFVFIAPEETLAIPSLLDTAQRLVARHGIRGLIIDPWNEFEQTRPSGQTETEGISQALTQIRHFARNHGVHVWVVAHPQKLYRREDGSYPVPTPYDISGSAHWRNKADNCLTLWRNEKEPDKPVQLHVQKIRFREVGKVGMVALQFDRITGRYKEATPASAAPWER